MERALRSSIATALASSLFANAPATGQVSIELQPSETSASVGDAVAFDVVLTSSASPVNPVAAVEMVFSWDPQVLRLEGTEPGPSNLLFSGFPETLSGGLNEAPLPTDGDAFYLGLAGLGQPFEATDTGATIATLQFTVVSTTDAIAEVRPLPSGGSPLVETRVFDGSVPNTIITGDLIAGFVEVTTPGSCAADLNADQTVNIDDLVLALRSFANTDAASPGAKRDPKLSHLLAVLAKFGQDCPG